MQRVKFHKDKSYYCSINPRNMETSITSEMISQQTICEDPENIEIVNDMEPKLTQSKEQMEIEQTRKNLIQAWKVYFK